MQSKVASRSVRRGADPGFFSFFFAPLPSPSSFPFFSRAQFFFSFLTVSLLVDYMMSNCSRKELAVVACSCRICCAVAAVRGHGSSAAAATTTSRSYSPADDENFHNFFFFYFYFPPFFLFWDHWSLSSFFSFSLSPLSILYCCGPLQMQASARRWLERSQGYMWCDVVVVGFFFGSSGNWKFSRFVRVFLRCSVAWRRFETSGVASSSKLKT